MTDGGKPPGETFCLYDAAQLNAVLDAMARQVAGLLIGRSEVAMIGILRRGEPLARMLQQRLSERFGLAPLPLYSLYLKRYADDLTLLHPHTELTENPQLAALDMAHTTLLVVDDVLYHGHSLLRTIAYLARLGATEIRTAVLVDRGAEKLPVRADIIGVRLDVAPTDIIECHVPPYEAELRIDVLRPRRD
jgi:pyrimidine operon attenuation protein/uracil phosphoribosyltransferase